MERGSGFRIARIIGIPIYIHFTWFIIFGLIVYSLTTGYFPAQYPDLPLTSYLAKGVVAALLLFASVLFHELGHSVVAIRNGVPILSITLFIFGGVARLKEDPREAWVEFKIAVAGPAASFALAGLFHAAARSGLGGPGAQAVTSYLALLNLILAGFNLLPAFPLDGGRILRALLWKFTSKMRATRISSGVGSFFALFLILNGIFGLITGAGLAGLWSILVGLFLREAAAGAYQQVQLDEVFSRIHVRDLMVTDCKFVPPHVSLEDAVQNYFLRYGYGGFPVEARGEIRGLVSLADIQNVPREEWPQTSVQAIMVPVDDRSTISTDSDVATALRKMAASGLSRLIAVDESHHCVGLITHNGILRRLRLQEKLAPLRN